jgi:hypothetical protein
MVFPLVMSVQYIAPLDRAVVFAAASFSSAPLDGADVFAIFPEGDPRPEILL